MIIIEIIKLYFCIILKIQIYKIVRDCRELLNSFSTIKTTDILRDKVIKLFFILQIKNKKFFTKIFVIK